MSSESWLFLFAALGGLGGIAAVAGFLLDVWPMIKVRKAVLVTKARALTVLVLLCMSVILSIAGLAVSYQSVDIPEAGPGSSLVHLWQMPNPNTCSVVANGDLFWRYRDHYKLVAGCFVSDGFTDQLDSPRMQPSALYDIKKGDITMLIRVSPDFGNYAQSIHAGGINFILWMVPVGVEPGQFTTARIARSIGARAVWNGAAGFPQVIMPMPTPQPSLKQ
jgi:hypothetical protein